MAHLSRFGAVLKLFEQSYCVFGVIERPRLEHCKTQLKMFAVIRLALIPTNELALAVDFNLLANFIRRLQCSRRFLIFIAHFRAFWVVFDAF